MTGTKNMTGKNYQKLNITGLFDDYEDYVDYVDYEEQPCNHYDKDKAIRTFMHYTDVDARKPPITVFGRERKGLFYNYDDRIIGDKWYEGEKIANSKGVTLYSAKYFEIILSHFHDAPVTLEHVLLGVNRGNGYSYLVFGYTYPQGGNQNENIRN